MEISIIQGNEKIPFWSEIQSRELNLVLEKNCDDCQTSTACKKFVSVKVVSGFQSFLAKSCKINKIFF